MRQIWKDIHLEIAISDFVSLTVHEKLASKGYGVEKASMVKLTLQPALKDGEAWEKDPFWGGSSFTLMSIRC